MGNDRNRVLMVSQCNMLFPFGEHLRPYYISKYIARMGWNIDHVCPMLEEGDQTIISKPYMSKSFVKNPHLLVRGLRDLAHIVGSGSYDAIYAHSIRNQLLLTAVPRRASIIFDVHGLGFMQEKGIKGAAFRLVETRTFKYPDFVIVTSNRSARILEEAGVSPSKIKVVTNGVDENKFTKLTRASREKIRKKLNLDGKFVVASVNNPSEPANVKALSLLERIATRTRDANVQDILFVVIGMRSASVNSSRNVKYMGFVDDLNHYLNAADAAILSYPDEAVRTGPLNKTLQFMACGLPVVSTTNGMSGIENASSGVHYVHCDDNDKDLLEKLLMIKEDYSLRKRIGDNARHLILSQYTWEKQAKRISDILTNVVNHL